MQPGSLAELTPYIEHVMSMHELAELPDGSVGHGGSIYDNNPVGDEGKEMTLVSLEDLEIAQRKRQRALFRRTVAFAILSVLVGICVENCVHCECFISCIVADNLFWSTTDLSRIL